jgi:DNA-binding MarR family transcriptional regulator
MMSEKQFKELMNSLKNIETKLDILVSLQKASMPKPKIPPEEESILNLCDGKHTIEDMVKETGKKSSYVRKILTELRKKGAIVSKRSEGEVIHKKV